MSISCPIRRRRRLDPPDVATALSALSAALAGVALLSVGGGSETVIATPDGVVDTVVRDEPLLAVWPGLAVVIVTTALAALPLLASGRAAARPLRVAVAIVAVGFVVAALLSIGSLYLPAAAFAVVAALLPDRKS